VSLLVAGADLLIMDHPRAAAVVRKKIAEIFLSPKEESHGAVGLDIFKLLPKTNCGDCGVPTCMAFAMKIAQKKAELSSCPHASEEAKAALGAASEPPVRQVKIGPGSGWESEARLCSSGTRRPSFTRRESGWRSGPRGVRRRSGNASGRWRASRWTGWAEVLKVNLFFITHDSREKSAFLKAVSLIKENSSKGLIIDCPDEDALKEGLELLRSDRPAVFLRRSLTEGDIQTAKAFGSSLVITAASLQDLADQAEKAKKRGCPNLILNSPGDGLGAAVQNNAILRRSALKKGFKPSVFPFSRGLPAKTVQKRSPPRPPSCANTPRSSSCPASTGPFFMPSLPLRQNIYTDPRSRSRSTPKSMASATRTRVRRCS